MGCSRVDGKQGRWIQKWSTASFTNQHSGSKSSVRKLPLHIYKGATFVYNLPRPHNLNVDEASKENDFTHTHKKKKQS